MFSAVAYYSASMVMIAQKAQARIDQVREEADAKHREDLAATQVMLIQQNTDLTADVQRLTSEIHALVVNGTGRGSVASPEGGPGPGPDKPNGGRRGAQ